MKCPYFLLSFVIILCAMSCGRTDSEQSKSNNITEEITSPEIYLEGNNSLLYEVSGNNLSKPSYLYGTMHVISKDKFKLGDNLEAKFNNVDYLVMEIKDITDLSALSSVISSVQLDSGALKDYVSDSIYSAFLTTISEKLQVTQKDFEQQYGSMKPFALYTLLLEKAPKSGPTKSYERVFMDKAYHKNLDLKGLETIEDQLNVFNAVSVSDMMVYLMTQLNSEDNTDYGDMMAELERVYTTGNLDSIANLIFHSDDILMTKYKKAFLTDRNKNWIPVIEQLITTNPCFIAVGAAHLPGEDGVIHLLRNQGYDVKAISVN